MFILYITLCQNLPYITLASLCKVWHACAGMVFAKLFVITIDLSANDSSYLLATYPESSKLRWHDLRHGMGVFFSPIGHYLFWIPCLAAGVIYQSTHFQLYFMVKTCWPTHRFLVLYLDFQRLHTIGKPRLHLVTESRFNFMIAAQVFLLDWVSAGRARKWLEAAAVESHPGNLFHMFL